MKNVHLKNIHFKIYNKIGDEMESEDIKKTQQEVRINSTTIVIVTILGFAVSLGLYIFFVIIPLRRTEQKADAVILSLQSTSSQVSKIATDVEIVLKELEDVGDSIEKRFQTERDLLCNEGPSTICANLDLGFDETIACDLAVNEIFGPLCFTSLQPPS